MHREICLSPNELEKHNTEGRYIWDTINWRLVSEDDVLKEALEEVEKAKEKVNKIAKRMNRTLPS